MTRLLSILAALLLFGQTPPTQARLPLEQIKLPPGFKIALYAEGLPNARQMALGDKGTLFVGSRTARRVYAVVDKDADGKADQVHTIATGLASPSGIAFRDGALYVAEISRVTRYDAIESHLESPPAPVVINDKLPTETHHGWKYLGFGPDGMLYVPIGAPCNVCERPDDERFATITRMRADGTGQEIFARGIRNTVGFDWHPQTGELWLAENGRDNIADDVPPDELLVAEHGSWNRSQPQGYRVMLIKLEGSKAVSYTPFAEGWLRGVRSSRGSRTLGDAWGRPADVLVMPDGSLLIADDEAGVIYRVTYTK